MPHNLSRLEAHLRAISLEELISLQKSDDKNAHEPWFVSPEEYEHLIENVLEDSRKTSPSE